MDAILQSTVHKTRGIEGLSLTDLEKIDAPQYTPSVKSLNKMMKPNSHAAWQVLASCSSGFRV